MQRIPQKITRPFLIVVIIMLASLHLALVLLNHYYFKTYAFDYGVYNFAFYDFAHLKLSACPVYMHSQSITFLQDHFSLTLIFLSPLYWLFSPVFGTYSLLIVQWLLILFGAWATYQFIFLKSHNFILAALSVIYYLVLYGRFSSYQADCNLVIMGSAIVPVFIYYFEKQKLLPTALSFILLIFNREDFALSLFFICLLLFIIHFRDKKKRQSALMFGLASVILFMCFFAWIIPALEDENKKFSLFNYETLGNSPYEVILFMLSHPIETVKLLFINHSGDPDNDFIKVIFYMVYFISGGFVLIFRPVYLIAFIPLIAKKMFNDEPFRWGHESYNGVEVVTLLPICVFSIISEFKSTFRKQVTVFLVITGTLFVSFYYMTHMSPLYYGFNKYSPLSSSLYHSDYDCKKIKSMLELIPKDASVSASGRLLPHLAFREKIYHFPKLKDADYVCVYRSGSTFPVSKERFDQTCDSLISSNDWKVMVKDGDGLFLKRNYMADKSK